MILLLRGEAVLDEVEGIPDEYLQMNGTYEMTAEQRVEWETEVRSLYDVDGADRRHADVGEADRLPRDAPERGRGAHPPTSGTPGAVTEPDPRSPIGLDHGCAAKTWATAPPLKAMVLDRLEGERCA